MSKPAINTALDSLREQFSGEIHTDDLSRMIYATDASVYQETPAAVAFPKSDKDIRLLIMLAREQGIGLIPRTAGTSLAGQVVGSGIVVDVSRYLNQVLEINKDESWVLVQPGVIRDELNIQLAEQGLFFGPETSTSNRAMIGGMLGNNSCGANSIVYGSMRDQVLGVTGFLSDGSKVTFAELPHWNQISSQQDYQDLDQALVPQIEELLADPVTGENILAGFPRQSITRRNTGYALDRLVIDHKNDRGTNLLHLIAGSEGTLMLATEIKLRCHPLPPPESGVLCAHFVTLDEALRATQIVMEHSRRSLGDHDSEAGSNATIMERSAMLDDSTTIFACELIDHFVLDGAARNLEQAANLQFVIGQPGAILMVELRSVYRDKIISSARVIRHALETAKLGYEFPLLFDEDAEAAWKVRKSGLGVVANVPGDAKPVSVIEDSAVDLNDLPQFIREVDLMLSRKYGCQCVHYGHAGAGELHLRPILNLKSREGVQRFRDIAQDFAGIVKQFRGSLSGEHGDGRVRAEFIRAVIGADNYDLLRMVKFIWDPQNVFNPGKIVDAPLATDDLRYAVDQPVTFVETVFDFSEQHGIQRAAEMCSGSGDCRKTQLTGGVMCPSYMATRNEKDTTRARANVLRQVLTGNESTNPLDDERIRDVMDLCLSCKGCKSECPSNVDVAKMKAEFLCGYYDVHGIPRRARLVAGFAKAQARASKLPHMSNWFSSNRLTSGAFKRFAGFHPARSLPQVHRESLRQWFARHTVHDNAGKQGMVLFFCDEFTNFIDVPVGIAAIELLERLGYAVEMPEHEESGRGAISQGLLHEARSLAQANVDLLGRLTDGNELPIVGVEPSALLTLRDEYPDLVGDTVREQAMAVARKSLLIDEFISQLIEQSRVDASMFVEDGATIRLHGHCHQKALSSMRDTIRMLQLPRNYQVKMIPSGCCGMAGAFGYEVEHYDLSMQIGELVLFPTVRDEVANSIIAAPGTSCRHQIFDGTGRKAFHPVQILHDALK
ncbi:MAG: FAD-binding and (Fe-S)-binding domain-containing protein [Pirellulaceae bacterium]